MRYIVVIVVAFTAAIGSGKCPKLSRSNLAIILIGENRVIYGEYG